MMTIQRRMLGLLLLLNRGPTRTHRSSSWTAAPQLHLLSRSFSSSKLFVGGISFRVDEEMLKKEFSEFGQVVDAKIIMDRESGRSRGFGFVTFAQDSEAEAAKAKMNNHLLDGRYIRVDLASNRPPASSNGNSSSSSSSSSSTIKTGPLSGFSFSSARPSRPPVVEDWGPLLSYGSSSSSPLSMQKSSPPPPPNHGGSTNVFGSGEQGADNMPPPQPTAMDTKTKVFDIAAGSLVNSTPHLAMATSEETGKGTTVGERDQIRELDVSSSSQVVSPRTKEEAEASSSSSLRSNPQTKPKLPALNNALPQSIGILDPSATFKPKLTVDSIPAFKGAPYDFGLSGTLSSLTSQAHEAGGSRPQGGGFDINLSFDNVEEEDPDSLPGYSIFSQRMLPPLDLPWGTPEADNWSEIGKEPRRIEDSPYSPFSSDLKDDPEFWWDPYDFDPEAKVFKEREVAEQASSVEAGGAEAEESLGKLFSKEIGAEAASLAKELGEERQSINVASL